jgi:hypothetical protein
MSIIQWIYTIQKVHKHEQVILKLENNNNNLNMQAANLSANSEAQ